MAALSPIVGGPIYRTVGKRSPVDFCSHSRRTQHTGGKQATTGIVHYKNWGGRLHSIGVHPGKVTLDYKSNVQYQK